jgi:hypothetical protein
MANEYFHRTPTSTGNRKIFTYAGWFKKNNGNGSDRFDIFNAYNTGSQAEEVGFRQDSLRYLSSGSSLYGFDTTNKYRDTSNWFHIVFALNTTLESERKRSVIYINGVEVDTTTSSGIGAYVAKNFDSIAFNVAGKEHNVLSRKYSSSGRDYVEGGGFDIFFVDGQALTPDVFGFFKEGKGYQSSGTTQATDFRPGQWVPKAPRTIKTEINRRGGFGVNGFYLPMNDSSNFGADFHTTPNSIITLKGEDLPQPRNGAPTTSDAYVSQLRSDPYAANLVLAVPGISTATGSNLITNGNFDSNVSNWTATDSTTAWENGQLKITRTAGSGLTANQAFTTETGKRYTISGTINSSTTRGDLRVYNGSGTGGSMIINISGTNGAVTDLTGSFTATSTTSTVVIAIDNNNGIVYVDNIVVKQEDAPRDYSADIKGSGTNKTPTLSGSSGVGYELGGYYGSAYTSSSNNDYLEFPGTSGDFNVGTGDFTIEMWLNPDSTQPTNARIFGQDGNSAGNWDIYIAGTSTSNQIRMMGGGTDLTGGNGSSYGNLVGDQWNHFCLERYDGQLTTYVNGVAVYSQSYTSSIGDNNTFRIGQIGSNVYSGVGYSFNGEIQDFRFYKGVAKYKGGFDVPKPYSPVGIESWRQVSDTCKNNFCTMNPLNHNNGTFANGNLTTSEPAANGAQIYATMGSNTGKWYYEAHVEDVGSPNTGGTLIGINPLIRPSSNVQNRTAYRSEGSMYNDSGTDSGNSAYAYVAGDTIGVAWDADNKRLWFAKNGTWLGSGDPAGNSNPNVNYTNTETQGPFIAYDNGTGAQVTHLNFGQNPSFSGQTTAGTYTDGNGKGLFKYQPPSGFLALCEDNLPTPAIADPGKHFKTVLYRGDGNTGHSITGVGFQPDLVWLKERTSTSSHQWHDSVRGAGNVLFSNTTNAESYSDTYLYSLDSDGFTLGSSGGVNASTDDYVAWCWKAGGAAVSNTDGSITTQVSANQTAGFSIVTGTQTSGTTTFGHGLSQAPDFIITKQTNGTTGWYTWHKGIPITETLRLDNNNASSSFSHWVTLPTDSVFSMGSGFGSGEAYVCYCWHEVEGFSKFGSYQGTGQADGPLVYCGFKPAWVMVKNADDTGGRNWGIQDSSRQPINPCDKQLKADSSEVENSGLADSTFQIDMLSNGFKVRNNTGIWNNNGETIIFAAFAESPFQTANAK